MDISLVILGLVSIMLAAATVYLIYERTRSSGASQNLADDVRRLHEEMTRLHFENRQELQGQLHRVNDQLYKGMSDQQRAMSDSRQTIQQQFEQTSKIIQEVTSKLTTLDSTNKQVLDFSSQLQNLQDVLRNPKQRGILGEYYLETLLKNILPPGSFEMQYRLGTDQESGKELIPDAVVFIKEKIVPVDSKFSLENYNRIIEATDPAERARLEKVFVNDLKNRIIETSKYIRPEKGTMDFAFMFIPHEAIYYDLLINKIGAIQEDDENLIQRAAGKYRVIIVSPTSFLAYLQTVLQALRALQIEETAQDMIVRVGELGKHVRAYAEYHQKLGNNLDTVVRQYNTSSNELKKVSKDVNRITKADDDLIETDTIERPAIEA